jgi:hypothetical protein
MAAERHGGRERRRNPRVVPGAHVEARLRNGEPVRVVDLSTEGLRVETEAPLVPGARSVLLVTTPEGDLEVAGRVTRCRMNAPNGTGQRVFVSGFLVDREISPEDRERLEDLVLDLHLTAQDGLPEAHRAVIAVDLSA